MRRVTVFGGSGFLGRYIVERLADRDIVVTVAVRHPERAKFLMPLGNVGQVVPVAASLHNAQAVAAAVAEADAVINLVGILAEGGRQTFKSVHADGAGRIARAAAGGGMEADRVRIRHRSLLAQLGHDPELLDRHGRELVHLLEQVRRAARLGPAELDLVLSYHLDGTELINLGVPVESLTELPYGAELRRLKSAVSNDDLQPLDDFISRVRASFDTMRAEYSVNQGSRS